MSIINVLRVAEVLLKAAKVTTDTHDKLPDQAKEVLGVASRLVKSVAKAQLTGMRDKLQQNLTDKRDAAQDKLDSVNPVKRWSAFHARTSQEAAADMQPWLDAIGQIREEIEIIQGVVSVQPDAADGQGSPQQEASEESAETHPPADASLSLDAEAINPDTMDELIAALKHAESTPHTAPPGTLQRITTRISDLTLELLPGIMQAVDKGTIPVELTQLVDDLRAIAQMGRFEHMERGMTALQNYLNSATSAADGFVSVSGKLEGVKAAWANVLDEHEQYMNKDMQRMLNAITESIKRPDDPESLPAIIDNVLQLLDVESLGNNARQAESITQIQHAAMELTNEILAQLTPIEIGRLDTGAGPPC